jgi:putative ABC transport system ATP-binding protein
MTEPSCVIALRDVWRTYRAGTPQAVHALRGVSLDIAPGGLVALKGRSGSGKTTLLNCIGSLDQPTSGSVVVFGRAVPSLSEAEQIVFRRRQVAFIFQSFGLNPLLSALENVELMPRLAGRPVAECLALAQASLERVGMTRWKHHRPDELSGGQQQRVAIARTLAARAPLLLADEPTGDLDTGTAREILALFRELVRSDGLTLLVASHDPLVEAYADRVLELANGTLISDAAGQPPS